MPGPVPVYEAVEWREPAPGGGSQAQVLRLSDGRFAIVKFPENGQGELVLANEFLACQLAELLTLPINKAVMVSVDERLLRLPRQNGQIPGNFSAGIRCGMIRFDGPDAVQPADIPRLCSNSAELHAVAVFDQLVCRNDGRQLLSYLVPGTSARAFAAYDYGFSFGGQPHWSAATLQGAVPPVLPAMDPFQGQPYQNGSDQAAFIDRLRGLTASQLEETLVKLHPPRWGVTDDDVFALIPFLQARAQALVAQFDERHRHQLEAL